MPPDGGCSSRASYGRPCSRSGWSRAVRSGVDLPVLRFGEPGGEPVIYFHGVPGAPIEAAFIADAARDAGVELHAIDRAQVAPGLEGERYRRLLADQVRRIGDGRPPPILGFSIGAALALRVAARLGEEAGPLLLLSTAGPLDSLAARQEVGAGERVFRAAQAGGFGLKVAVRGQAMLARVAPDALRALLFAGADPSDRALAADPAHRSLLARVLGQAFADGGAGYRRDLLAYADDWAAELAEVTADVRMWHGRADRWSPIGMARGVAEALPVACRVREGGAGHYTTLIACAREAFAAIVDESDPPAFTGTSLLSPSLPPDR